jgi:ABC-type transport system involved in Fe-S cluster assembly fused permease/ATPase subunit
MKPLGTLDNWQEKLVQEALEILMEGHFKSMIIAHRLSTDIDQVQFWIMVEISDKEHIRTY